MSLVINHNMMAANVARNLNSHYANLAKSTQRLSTGMRVNSAADDAAGLAIRELQRADIAALQQGARNANDAISMIQVADGALSIIDEKLIRMKELAEQAATGTYDSTQRLMIESEYQAMASEITRIARATDFNGMHLLDGTLESEEHDGSGLTATGKMKVHFGTGNDSAEDYYYIRIPEASSEAFSIGNASTWQDASRRIGTTFTRELEAKLKAVYNDPDLDDALKDSIRTAAKNWSQEFLDGLDGFTEFSSANDLERLYKAFSNDSEVSELSSVFENAIDNFSSINSRDRQKMQYALGRAAMRAVAQNPGAITGFGDTFRNHTVTSGINGLLADGTAVNSAFTTSADGSTITYKNEDGDNATIKFIPPSDYNAGTYVPTSTSSAPTNYPLSFTAPVYTELNSSVTDDSTGDVYTFDTNGDLASYTPAGGGTTYYDGKDVTAYKDDDISVTLESGKYLASYEDDDGKSVFSGTGNTNADIRSYTNKNVPSQTKFDSSGNISEHRESGEIATFNSSEFLTSYSASGATTYFDGSTNPVTTGNVTEYVDATGRSIFYPGAGTVRSYEFLDGSGTTRFDTAGNVMSFTDSSGNVYTFHDTIGTQVKSVTLSDGYIVTIPSLGNTWTTATVLDPSYNTVTDTTIYSDKVTAASTAFSLITSLTLISSSRINAGAVPPTVASILPDAATIRINALANKTEATNDLNDFTTNVQPNKITLFSTASTAMTNAGIDFSASDFSKFVTAINSSLAFAVDQAARSAENYDYAGFTIATQEDAQKAIEALNNAIVQKDKIRADLGALQNRLENTITNLNTQAENLQAAESRISDVDVATEMTEFTRQQILSQSAVAMLAQANSLPQMAMQLIGG